MTEISGAGIAPHWTLQLHRMGRKPAARGWIEEKYVLSFKWFSETHRESSSALRVRGTDLGEIDARQSERFSPARAGNRRRC